jgi:hypothetical protein
MVADIRLDTGREDVSIEQDQQPVKLVIDASPVASLALAIGFGF